MQVPSRLPGLVVVVGAPRSGVALVASQLARHPSTMLVDAGRAAGLAWLRAWLQDPLAPPPIGALRDAYGGKGIPGAPDWLVVAAHGLLDEPTLLAGLSEAAFTRGAIRVVWVQRSLEACAASAARFPHLLPTYPSPWVEPEAFAAAYGQLWHRHEKAAQALQARLPTQQIRYEDLAAEPELSLARLRGALGWPTAELRPGLRGISESLCFRERPVDQAGIGGAALPVVRDRASEPLLLATGRGGSGTRVLSDLLLALGVDLGERLNPMGDSIQWADLVYEISLGQLQGQSRAQRGDWVTLLRQRADALGSGQRGVWGFKVPELMLMLEVLLAAWPQTTIVHLVRHPLDVCLRRTHMTSRINNPIGRATLTAAYRYFGLHTYPDDDEAWWCNVVSWRFQLEMMQSAKRRFPGRIVDLRFEDLCSQPQGCADNLAMHFGIGSQHVDLPIQPGRLKGWDISDYRANDAWYFCRDIALDYKYTLC